MNDRNEPGRGPAPQEAGLLPRADGLPPMPQPPHGVVSFRYAATEISLEDGQPRLRRRALHYADGRLVNEEWDGMLAAQAYKRMMAEAQALFLQQLAATVRLMTGGFFGGGR